MTANGTQPAGLLTVDVEDWYQLTGDMFADGGRSHAEILQRQMDRLLDLLSRRGCRATFFCLGKSLVHVPRLVKRMAEAGHEIATHGWAHDRIFRMGLDAFGDDLRRSIDWLSDLTGRPVLGHRAAVFSVAPEQLEGFYDVCFEAGLLYDSSVFPIQGRRYGVPDAPPTPQIVRSNGDRRLFELPLATVEWLGRRWPVAGGGWWRIMPTPLIRRAIGRYGRTGSPATLYFHPCEFDTHPLRAGKVANRSLRSTIWGLQQNLGRSSIFDKLDTLMSTHRFIAAEDYIRGEERSAAH